jgi:Rrf2 family protein
MRNAAGRDCRPRVVLNGRMRVSAKADYAVRAAVELAVAPTGQPVQSDAIAAAQQIPLPFLANILVELREHGLVQSEPGTDAGYRLARTPGEITIGAVISSVDGPLASVHGNDPGQLAYEGAAAPLKGVWVALRANVHGVLDEVTLADVVAGALPDPVRGLGEHPDSALDR